MKDSYLTRRASTGRPYATACLDVVEMGARDGVTGRQKALLAQDEEGRSWCHLASRRAPRQVEGPRCEHAAASGAIAGASRAGRSRHAPFCARAGRAPQARGRLPRGGRWGLSANGTPSLTAAPRVLLPVSAPGDDWYVTVYPARIGAVNVWTIPRAGRCKVRADRCADRWWPQWCGEIWAASAA